MKTGAPALSGVSGRYGRWLVCYTAPMVPEQRTDIVEILDQSRLEFASAAAGLSHEQARTRPQPDRWSVMDCVEHVTGVEERFLKSLENAARLDQPKVDKAKEAELMVRIPDRSTRVKAPEAIWPKGRFSDLAEALAQFEATRRRTMAFAAERGPDLYLIDSAHPRLGPMNGYEMLLVISGHSRRHAEQIRETRTAIGAV